MGKVISPTDASVWEANWAAIHRRWPATAEALSAAALTGAGNAIGFDNAQAILAKAAPSGECTEPLLVAGVDLAVWAALHQLPCNVAMVPAHRPPIYLLARRPADLSALRALDCSALFADPRAQLFVGDDAVQQCLDFQFDNPHIPAARKTITLDPTLFKGALSGDDLWPSHFQRYASELDRLEKALAGLTSRMLAEPRPQSLRVLGVSSRYTTFLQHSMRDWLDSLRALGHETELVIESFDHEQSDPISLARVALQFRPDLIVMIDHYRNELRGLPKNVPFVMWVQDELTNMFCPEAGVAQGPLDFCLGFGRLHLSDRCGYPQQRFETCPVGVNIRRFVPSDRPEAYACDLSFVSNASAPATTLLETQLLRADVPARKMLIDVFEWLKSRYDGAGYVTHLSLISRHIDQTLERYGMHLSPPQRQTVDDFFITRINNALFRHQALSWAAESGLRLQLWGRGWEQHGRLRRFAKGVACNQTQLRDIYHRSAINLQIVPTGAVHQRLLDGLAAGGFFLLRETAGDRVELFYQRLWDACGRLHIDSDDELIQSRDPIVASTLAVIQQSLGVNPLELPVDLMDLLRLSVNCGFTRSAASVWEDYPAIAFGSREQFLSQANRYLQDQAERQAIVDRMRTVVINRFSYDAINQRMLGMIERELPRPTALAA